jgi:hypothetical protein
MTFSFRADADPHVGRVFVCCRECQRVVPYYQLYGKNAEIARLGCQCGSTLFRPVTIPEWKAFLWLAWAWVQGKGDPRMPVHQVANKYA